MGIYNVFETVVVGLRPGENLLVFFNQLLVQMHHIGHYRFGICLAQIEHISNELRVLLVEPEPVHFLEILEVMAGEDLPEQGLGDALELRVTLAKS